MIECGLNDTIQIKKNEVMLIEFTHLQPLIWIFERFWYPSWFWQKKCQRKAGPVPWKYSYLKYALKSIILPFFFYPNEIFDSQSRNPITFLHFSWFQSAWAPSFVACQRIWVRIAKSLNFRVTPFMYCF